MTEFTISSMSDSNILSLIDIRESILLEPEYQRPGGVWSTKKKQLFIDSLLNGYDVPKLYFHVLSGEQRDGVHKFAVIDGRQRVETIYGFVDGDFSLSDEFVLLSDPNTEAKGKSFAELEEQHPRLRTRFLSRGLSIQLVSTDDLDFIEDMFSRLNEAVPLNSAEKRNALGGPVPRALRDLSRHVFFADTVRVASGRYRHYDIAVKMLIEEWSLQNPPEYISNDLKVVDTKRATLDQFVKDFEEESDELNQTLRQVGRVLTHMDRVFNDRDPLLRSAGMVVVYYVLFSRALEIDAVERITREQLVNFEALRAENRERFQNEEEDVSFALIEYDELAQSSNDASAIAFRSLALAKFLDIDI